MDINWFQIEQMLKLGATLKEVALITGISQTHLRRELKSQHGKSWTEYKEEMQATTKLNSRADLIRMAKYDSKAAIFAAKSFGKLVEYDKQQEIDLDKRRVAILEDVEKIKDELFTDEILDALLEVGSDD